MGNRLRATCTKILNQDLVLIHIYGLRLRRFLSRDSTLRGHCFMGGTFPFINLPKSRHTASIFNTQGNDMPSLPV